MNNKLIERKENIFTKIRNFFKGLFYKKEKFNDANLASQNIEEIEKTDTEKYETDKREFLDLYENAKQGKVDMLSLSSDTLEKMCELLEEEIKIKERNNEIKRAKLNAY